MQKLPLFLFSLLILLGCNAQEEPTAEELPKLDQLKKIMYQTGKPLFEPVPDGLSEPKPQNGLPWKVEGEKLNLNDFIASFNANSKVEVKESFGRESIQIRCNIPEGMAINNNYLSVSIEENNLKDRAGKAIELKDELQIGSGSGSNSTRVNGKMVVQNTNFLTFSSDLAKDANYQKPIKGTLKLKMEYKDNFAIAEVSKSDEGKSVDFNGDAIKVIKIDGNRAIYDIEELSASDYRTMNTDKGVQLGLNFEKRDELKLGMNAGVLTATLDKQAYQIFEVNPEISEKDFGEKIHSHLLKVLRDPNLQKDRITISKQLGPVKTLVFYKELVPQSGSLNIKL